MSTGERFETKFVFAGAEVNDAAHWLTQHRGLRIEHPPRLVHSIYFDTATLTFANASVNGELQRSKPRLRWYTLPSGICFYPTEVKLELKIKCGACGTKRRVVAGHLGEDPGTMLANGMRLGMPDPAFRAMATQPLFQTLHVIYHRSYFVGNQGVRITLDTDLCFTKPQTYARYNETIPSLLSIIEVKFDPSDTGTAEQLLSTLQTSPMRFSKYLRGLHELSIYSPS